MARDTSEDMLATVKPRGAVHYPESDDMAEHEIQRLIAELLRPLLAEWLAAQGRVAHAGADQFFYWVEGNNRVCRAPDVYVVDGVSQEIPAVGTWKVWEGHAPSFALEIACDDWKKDYEEAPPDYDAMGTRELVVYDPFATTRSRKRVRWQVWRRVRGRLTRVLTSSDDRVQCRSLGCWLRVVSERGQPLVRLATGARGRTLVPTAAERARGEIEAAKGEIEAARAEVARLRAQLARLGAG